jgi:hypothetical protein
MLFYTRFEKKWGWNLTIVGRQPINNHRRIHSLRSSLLTAILNWTIRITSNTDLRQVINRGPTLDSFSLPRSRQQVVNRRRYRQQPARHPATQTRTLQIGQREIGLLFLLFSRRSQLTSCSYKLPRQVAHVQHAYNAGLLATNPSNDIDSWKVLTHPVCVFPSQLLGCTITTHFSNNKNIIACFFPCVFFSTPGHFLGQKSLTKIVYRIDKLSLMLLP